MAEKRNWPWLCIAPPPTSSNPRRHTDCQTEPFQVHYGTEPSGNGARIWIGYRHKPTQSYQGRLTFQEVLEQAKANLLSSNLDAFPGLATRVPDSSMTQKLKAGQRAYKRACCAGCHNVGLCNPEHPINLEWIPFEAKARGGSKKGFVIACIFNLQGEEMFAIVQHFHGGKYRPQRDDESVTPDMAITTEHSRETAQAASTNLHGSLSTTIRRRSSRLSSQSQVGNEVLPDNPTGSGQSTNNDGPRHVGNTTEGDHPASARGRLAERYGRMIARSINNYGIKVFRITAINTCHEAMRAAVLSSDEPALKQAYGALEATVASSPFNQGPDTAAEEHHRMAIKMIDEYGAGVFSIAEVTELNRRMDQAVKDDDRKALCQAYGAVRAFMLATLM